MKTNFAGFGVVHAVSRSLYLTLTLLALSVLGLSGCSSLIPPATPDPTRYFVLTSPTSVAAQNAQPTGGLQLGIRVVEVPAYLRTTKSLVVRTGQNEVRFQDYSRWAEPLETGIARVLKDSLAAAPAIAGVQTVPLRSDVRRDYDIVIRIVQCEGVVAADGKKAARFVAAYEIVSADGTGKVQARGQFTAPDAPWDGADFGALAQSLSGAIAALAEQIASAASPRS